MTKEHKSEGSHPMPRLKAYYRERVIPALMESMGMSNPFEIPRLLKIVVNIGVNEAKENIQALDAAKEELGQITGQLPQIRRAKKSISNFKLRQGMPIAVRVTLRGDRMYEFLDRLIAIAIPRLRDFRGLEPGGFDGYGNYNLGLQEQHIFPEINLEKSAKTRGMNISFVTSVRQLHRLRGEQRDAAGMELLGQLGMPFRKRAPVATKTPAAPTAAALTQS